MVTEIASAVVEAVVDDGDLLLDLGGPPTLVVYVVQLQAELQRQLCLDKRFFLALKNIFRTLIIGIIVLDHFLAVH